VKTPIIVLIVLGLLSTGFEGVLDAAHVTHDGTATGLHEEHDPHPQHPSSPGQPDSEGDVHYCHCGLHVPPLFASVSLATSELQHIDPVTISTFNTLMVGPPPLPPPIA
jgi:hypothetical protein